MNRIVGGVFTDNMFPVNVRPCSGGPVSIQGFLFD